MGFLCLKGSRTSFVLIQTKNKGLDVPLEDSKGYWKLTQWVQVPTHPKGPELPSISSSRKAWASTATLSVGGRGVERTLWEGGIRKGKKLKSQKCVAPYTNMYKMDN